MPIIINLLHLQVLLTATLAILRHAEALRHHLVFVQNSMVTGGLGTIAGHLLQNDLITQQNYTDALAACGRGPLEQATILTNSIMLKIKHNPGVYFPCLIEALRQSDMSDAADTLQTRCRHTTMQKVKNTLVYYFVYM